MKPKLYLNTILKNKKSYWILLIVITLVSFALRFSRIDSPEYIDEQIYVKLTRFLSYGHLASSSSLLHVYVSHGALLSWDNELAIVEPWFDHPPLFSILDIPFWSMGLPRLLPIVLGALSTFLVMYLLREKAFESVLAGLIFAFFPFAIQLNAMMFLDNGSSFFFLLTIALTSKYKKNRSEKILYLAGSSAGFSFLCKEIGIYSILYLLFYLLFSGKLTKHFKVLIPAIGIASTWFVIGFLLNKGLFIDVITTQIGVAGAADYQSLLRSAVYSFNYNLNEFSTGNISPILLFSWISLGSFAFGKGHKIIKLGILSFILTMLTIKLGWFYTWIAMYPFFSITIAYFINEMISVLVHTGRSFVCACGFSV